jgi:large subunit ribosomal protein L21
MIGDDDRTIFDGEGLANAKVVAEVVLKGRADKVIAFKYKSKVRYRKKIGHRQPFSRLMIKEILTGGESQAAASEPRRRRSTRASAAPAEEAAPAAEEAE